MGPRLDKYTPEEDEKLGSLILAGRQLPEKNSVSAVRTRAYKLRLSFKRLKAKAK